MRRSRTAPELLASNVPLSLSKSRRGSERGRSDVVPIHRHLGRRASAMDDRASSARTPADRFWPKVAKSPGCWNWTAGLDSKGYGQFRVSTQQKIVAHRFAYELLVGPIPAGLQLDHLCRNRQCVNPDHLEPVDSRTNTLRGEGPTAQHARKTHCCHGHELTDDNVRRTKRGARVCLTCERGRR